jgi:hypothetical protein
MANKARILMTLIENILLWVDRILEVPEKHTESEMGTLLQWFVTLKTWVSF